MTVKNLQDKYLNELVANKKTVEINLINGLLLICKIEKFDNFSLQINYNNSITLVYKHAISYISLKNFKKK
jgi:RNA chaperone Hfq